MVCIDDCLSVYCGIPLPLCVCVRMALCLCHPCVCMCVCAPVQEVLVMEYLPGVRLVDGVREQYRRYAASQGRTLEDMEAEQRELVGSHTHTHSYLLWWVGVCVPVCVHLWHTRIHCLSRHTRSLPRRAHRVLPATPFLCRCVCLIPTPLPPWCGQVKAGKFKWQSLDESAAATKRIGIALRAGDWAANTGRAVYNWTAGWVVAPLPYAWTKPPINLAEVLKVVNEVCLCLCVCVCVCVFLAVYVCVFMCVFVFPVFESAFLRDTFVFFVSALVCAIPVLNVSPCSCVC